MQQVRYEEKAKRNLVLVDRDGFDFGLNYSIAYHQLVTPLVLSGTDYPKSGGLENQDPAYLEDLQTIYKLRLLAKAELEEDGIIATLDRMAKLKAGR